ncbi:DUF4279 domain-containing protein [Pseudomonas amygdali]|uniref:DUF4279 domain-containing protein n=1 Tax=Pseudomonas amygdali TaxID=47877 RepID=UPI0006B9F35E|nr:DUF4279 domain-containing protein [Pseudomonas amygdali]
MPAGYYGSKAVIHGRWLSTRNGRSRKQHFGIVVKRLTTEMRIYMTTTGEVYFAMYGDNFEPDEVTAYIGLTATEIFRKGPRSPDAPLRRNSCWSVSNGRIESDLIDVYEMSEALVTRLAPFAAKIVEAKQKFNLRCVFQTVLWIDQDEEAPMPAIGFGLPVIDFIHIVGATIDIDTYRN